MRGYCDDEYVISKTMDAGLVNAGQARKANPFCSLTMRSSFYPFFGDESIVINWELVPNWRLNINFCCWKTG